MEFTDSQRQALENMKRKYYSGSSKAMSDYFTKYFKDNPDATMAVGPMQTDSDTKKKVINDIVLDIIDVLLS